MTGKHVMRLLVDGPAPGAWNMAVDEMLLHPTVSASEHCLRFYQWSEPTLSLGYFQSASERNTHPVSGKAPIVRRSTGGGAILHDQELTYSLILGPGHPCFREPVSLYAIVHNALIRALAGFGVSARLCDSARGKTSSEPFLCFQRRADTDVVVADHKVCGSAQRRHRGRILQHGSVVLSSSRFAPEIEGIREVTGVEFTPVRLARQWLDQLSIGLGATWRTDKLTADEIQQATRLQVERFAAPSWLNRR